jgi:hypothetical protein
VAILVTAAAVSAFDFSFRVSPDILQARREFHEQILSHTANAPENYRILVPYILEVPIRALSWFMPYDKALSRAYAAFHLLAITGILWTLFSYLRVWFTGEQALAGCLVVASTIPIALRQNAYFPSSLLEPSFFTVGLLLMLKERLMLFWALVVVASLNRETAFFIPLLYVLTKPLTRKHVLTGLVYIGTWACVFLGLRAVMGDAPRYWDLATICYTNTHTGRFVTIAENILLFLGGFWVFAIFGFKRAPVFVQRSARVVPAYLAAVSVWGLWWEVRLLMPLYSIVLPLALSWLFEPHKSDGPQPRGAAETFRPH